MGGSKCPFGFCPGGTESWYGCWNLDPNVGVGTGVGAAILSLLGQAAQFDMLIDFVPEEHLEDQSILLVLKPHIVNAAGRAHRPGIPRQDPLCIVSCMYPRNWQIR